MSATPVLSARLLLRGGHSVDLALERVEDLKKHMAENDGHIVTAYLVSNRELHLFVRDIVGIEIQHEASAHLMQALAERHGFG